MDAKREVRAGVLRGRSLRPAADLAGAGELIRTHGLGVVGDIRVVAAYASVGSEPPTRPLLEALLERGVRVLLPVATAEGGLAWGDLLDWAQLVSSATGLLEPIATADAAEAARAASLMFIPAVAVDRGGHRLGRGGGFFDRWLPERRSGRVLAVVYDDEVLDAVPHEPHDRRVDAALTPSGVVPLGPAS